MKLLTFLFVPLAMIYAPGTSDLLILHPIYIILVPNILYVPYVVLQIPHAVYRSLHT
jgi:hypothetical protein